MNYSFASKLWKSEYFNPELTHNIIDQDPERQFVHSKPIVINDNGSNLPEIPSIVLVEQDAPKFKHSDPSLKSGTSTQESAIRRRARFDATQSHQHLNFDKIDVSSIQSKIKTRTHQKQQVDNTINLQADDIATEMRHRRKIYKVGTIVSEPVESADRSEPLMVTKVHMDLDPAKNNILRITMNEQYTQMVRMHKSIKHGAANPKNIISFGATDADLKGTSLKHKMSQSSTKTKTNAIGMADSDELVSSVAKLPKAVSASIVKFSDLGKFDEVPLTYNIVTSKKIVGSQMSTNPVFDADPELSTGVVRKRRVERNAYVKPQLAMDESQDLNTKVTVFRESEPIRPTKIPTLYETSTLKSDATKNHNVYYGKKQATIDHNVSFENLELVENRHTHDPAVEATIKPQKHVGEDLDMNWSSKC